MCVLSCPSRHRIKNTGQIAAIRKVLPDPAAGVTDAVEAVQRGVLLVTRQEGSDSCVTAGVNYISNTTGERRRVVWFTTLAILV